MAENKLLFFFLFLTNILEIKVIKSFSGNIIIELSRLLNISSLITTSNINIKMTMIFEHRHFHDFKVIGKS